VLAGSESLRPLRSTANDLDARFKRLLRESVEPAASGLYEPRGRLDRQLILSDVGLHNLQFACKLDLSFEGKFRLLVQGVRELLRQLRQRRFDFLLPLLDVNEFCSCLI